MPTWFDRIASTLESSGYESRQWKTGAGRLLVTPHAARVLACQIEGVEGNLFWHSPELEDPKKAKARFDAAGGCGGDRFWLAPEVAFMWEDLAAARIEPLKSYRLPGSMDPADWKVVEDSDGHLRLTTEIRLTDFRTKKKIALRADRRLSVSQPPDGLPRGLRGVSFSITNVLTLLECDAGAVVGGWDLLQLPPVGQLLCPTVTHVNPPRSYYDPFGDRHVICTDDHVRFVIDGKHRIKMGLTPMQTTGRMGYLRKAGSVWTLIFRAFAPLPGEPYVDLPRASAETFGGDALQAYNDKDDGIIGGFGEMEYHDPALVAGRTPSTRSGSSVTHVLAGDQNAINEAVRLLLGVRL